MGWGDIFLGRSAARYRALGTRRFFSGECILTENRRGRRPHRPTDQSRKTLLILRGLGWTEEGVAAALGMTAKTLRKHYSTELRLRRHGAREQLAAENLLALWGKASGGNLAAMMTMRRLIMRATTRQRA
jgi:hypothetical protein